MLRIVGVGGQKISDDLKRFEPVEIIGINHGEGCLGLRPGAERGVAGSPGFGARNGAEVSRDAGIERLNSVLILDSPGEFGPEYSLEIVAEFLPDNKHDPAKPGPDRIKK